MSGWVPPRHINIVHIIAIISLLEMNELVYRPNNPSIIEWGSETSLTPISRDRLVLGIRVHPIDLSNRAHPKYISTINTSILRIIRSVSEKASRR